MSTSRVLPPHWSQVIDRIHAAIGTALDATTIQEQRLALPLPATAPHANADEAVNRLQERLAAMQASCERAAQTQAEADTALDDATQRLVSFLADLSPPARNLANDQGRAVS